MSHAYYLSLVSVSVSPVLTPPESEKADSEERVSLKVCSQHSSVISASFFFNYYKCILSKNIFMFDDSTREACKKAILIFHLVFVLLDSKTSGGSLYSHLCGALQVSASGEERFGAAVSKIPLFTVCVCVICYQYCSVPRDEKMCTWTKFY